MSIKIITLIIIYLFTETNSYTINFPTLKRNYAVVRNVNINKLSDIDRTEFVKLFNSVPLIMFKNQKINPEEYYEFCKLLTINILMMLFILLNILR